MKNGITFKNKRNISSAARNSRHLEMVFTEAGRVLEHAYDMVLY
jgi:hypothetical protein